MKWQKINEVIAPGIVAILEHDSANNDTRVYRIGDGPLDYVYADTAWGLRPYPETMLFRCSRNGEWASDDEVYTVFASGLDDIVKMFVEELEDPDDDYTRQRWADAHPLIIRR